MQRSILATLLIFLTSAGCTSSSLAFHAAPAAAQWGTLRHLAAGSRHPAISAPPRTGVQAGALHARRSSAVLRMANGMDSMSPEEGMVERMVEKLEASLESAIEKEHYKDASTLSRELSTMHLDESASVLQCNSMFYKAFSTKDIDLMGKVWLDDSEVQCIHPGAKPLVGYKDILVMWSNMFSTKDKVFRSTDIKPDGIKVLVRGTSALVMCNEQVSTPVATRRMTATNIFRKYTGQWFMVHHHASQAVRAESLEESLQWRQGGRTIRIDGTFKGKEGEGGSSKNVMDEIVKAIQGALNGEDVESKHPDIEVLKFGSDDSLISGRMIVEEEESDMWDESDDDDDDDQGDDFSSLPTLSSFLPSNNWGSSREAEEKVRGERELTREVTERAVEAIRRLANKGVLSREHKRRLLSDIVKHHQIGDGASAVEISYQLLVMNFLRLRGGALREEELLEDFAEQCKILAKRLP